MRSYSLNDRDFEIKIREREPRTFTSALKTALRLEALCRSKKEEPTKGRFDDRPRSRHISQRTSPSSANFVSGRGDQYRDRLAKESSKSKSSGYKGAKMEGELQARSSSEQDSRSLLEQVERLNQDLTRLKTEVRQKADSPPSSSTFQFETPSAQQLPAYVTAPSQGRYNTNSQTPTVAFQPRTAWQGPPRPPPAAFSRCYECNAEGHFRRDCPYRQQNSAGYQKSQQPDPTPSSHIRAAAASSSITSRVYLNVKIRGKTRQCLMDSDCEITVIPSKLVEKHHIRRTNKDLLAANGTKIPVLGSTVLQASIGGTQLEIAGLVSEHVDIIMLGIDFLTDHDVNWSFVKAQVTVDGQLYKLSPRRGRQEAWCRRVVVAQESTIPARSEFNLPTKAVYQSVKTTPELPTEQWSTEPTVMKNGLLVGATLLPDQPQELYVRVLNPTDNDIKVSRGVEVAELQPVAPLERRQQPDRSQRLTATEKEAVEEMVSRVDPSISDTTKNRLRSLLIKHASVFSMSEWDLGYTDKVEHRIDTQGHPPFRQPLRRYPAAHQEVIDKFTDEMLQNNVIEPANSPWASNVVLAKKKDGLYRVCVDYRQLNSITKGDAYPLPRIDDCLDTLKGCKLYSSVDCRSGFMQCPVSVEDRPKTAFITRRGMFQFTKMPFGLCNAPATFERLIDLLLRGLNEEICLSYLDDIILFSHTEEEHLERLDRLLVRLKEANLKLKPTKCTFLQKEILFLGYIVSEKGLSTDPEKTKLIEDWPVPGNLRELRGFLGLSGYYRRFIKGYSAIAAPLHDLTKKSRAFVWTEECQHAFDQLKRALTTSPVLALPDDHGEFILDTDASDRQIGAVLSQRQDDTERVIYYAGRKLNDNKINYCVTRKELLAIVHFTKLFRQYLLGRKFTIRTDHAAL